MKVCPVCKSRCFDDMDTCYGCMHNFNEVDDLIDDEISSVWKEDVMDSMIPEFFELDTFPVVEDEECFRIKGAHEKPVSKNNEKIVIKLEVPKSVLEKYIV